MSQYRACLKGSTVLSVKDDLARPAHLAAPADECSANAIFASCGAQQALLYTANDWRIASPLHFALLCHKVVSERVRKKLYLCSKQAAYYCRNTVI